MFLLSEFKYLVIDNFYGNIDEVRKYALSLDYTVKGNYPGIRTESATGLNGEVKEAINYLFKNNIIENEWDTQYNGSFQSIIEGEETWVHADSNNDLNAILYLSENPPLDCGVSFYRELNYGSRSLDELNDKEHNNLVENGFNWEEETFIPGSYNRMVIFNSKLWHCGKGFFGDSLYNSRLTQCFFICFEEN